MLAATFCFLFQSDSNFVISISTLCLMMNLEIFVEYLVYRDENSKEDLIWVSVKSHHLAHLYLVFCWLVIGDWGAQGTSCYASVLIVGWVLKMFKAQIADVFLKVQSICGRVEKVLNLPNLLGRLGYISAF